MMGCIGVYLYLCCDGGSSRKKVGWGSEKGYLDGSYFGCPHGWSATLYTNAVYMRCGRPMSILRYYWGRERWINMI